MQNTFSSPSNKRNFIPADLIFSKNNLEPIFENLKNRAIHSVEDLEKWLLDRSELEAALDETLAWKYIKSTCDTTDLIVKKDFEDFVTEVEPIAAATFNELNKKLIASTYLEQLDSEKYHIYLRSIRNQIELFRPENIELMAEIQVQQQEFGTLAGSMSIHYQDKEFTLEQASNFLKSVDRKQREDVYTLITNRRLQDREALNNLLTTLIAKRDQVAKNAGFSNYRDYKFRELGRFDFGVKECEDFHQAISDAIIPIVNSFTQSRQKELSLKELKPFDMDVDTASKEPLKPFDGADDLFTKTRNCFNRVDPYLSECLETMKTHRLFDLESRKGKAPGGYNYPLSESGMPFIFMNSANSFRDMITMIHEGGHAVHTFISSNLSLNGFKNVPSEVAELASMGMELITMDYWDEFFSNAEELKRAKKEHLEDLLMIFPWIAIVDKFQHWLYVNPNHTAAERETTWSLMYDELGNSLINWDGFSETRKTLWQKQLHIFEVPFYYIEYGMAQLGAIAIWKNYQENPSKTIEQYLNALRLGYTKPVSEIYKTAGISFDFSTEYILSLSTFIQKKMEELG